MNAGTARAARYQPRRARPERSARDDRDEDRPRTNGSAETMPFDALPPAIGREDEDEPAAEERKPRRRTRAARPADGDDEVAPAA